MTDASEIEEYRRLIYSAYRTGQGRNGTDDREARAPYLKKLIRRSFPKDKSARVLDLGCGNGTLLFFLREAGFRCVEGVDTSEEQVASARDLGLAGVVHGDLFAKIAACKDRSYQVLVSLDVIEHQTKPELLVLARHALRVLAFEGRWVLHVPNAGALFGANARYADWTHEQSFTPESVRQFLTAVGFMKIDRSSTV
jgi:2-polyprenyl-3-methyl-5-hydroxy-6-metoxy-1,4-benzoquinol methylase